LYLITLPALNETCFGNERDSESRNPKNSKPKVLGFSEICVRYKHTCLGQNYYHSLSDPNFQKQINRI
uniref:Uncharacterized protein n=1 Tax=Pan troglodytes TaxID=9598 RepID=A0A2I3TNI7_PANTR